MMGIHGQTMAVARGADKSAVGPARHLRAAPPYAEMEWPRVLRLVTTVIGAHTTAALGLVTLK
jgi:hypothetical protein